MACPSSTTTPSKNRRIEWIDIAKGIGILLVVYGHAMAPGRPYVYLFHMPFFMMLSGYVYNPDEGFLSFLKKKICRLYIPFMGWNALITLLRIVIYYYKGNEHRLAQRLEVLPQIFFCMNKDGSYFGATWFMATLFLISILYKLIDMALPRIPYRQLILLAVIGAVCLFEYHHNLPSPHHRNLHMFFFYASGCCLRLHSEDLKQIKGLKWFLLFFVPFVALGIVSVQKLLPAVTKTYCFYVLIALLGSFSTILLSKGISGITAEKARPFKQSLIFLGIRSMDILLWHFIAFRAVVAVQLYLEGISVRKLFHYNNRYDTSGYWWIAYFAVGVAGSLLWGWFLRQGPWGRFLKKIHMV